LVMFWLKLKQVEQTRLIQDVRLRGRLSVHRAVARRERLRASSPFIAVAPSFVIVAIFWLPRSSSRRFAPRTPAAS
jgi:hypothetical protein